MKRRSVLPGLMATLAIFGIAPRGHARTGRVDRVVVLKRKRVLQLISKGDVVHSFRIALGREPRGDKRFEGDGRTPEGLYWLDSWKGDSRFYKAIRISYPNRADVELASRMGRSAGGAIMVHGLASEIEHWGPNHYLFNWTEGCIAVTNEEMDVIWNSVRPGTPIEIRP
ncbi:MAG: L,D-transpeptidase family protein [Geminicoccaceae bacterium]